MSAGDRAVMPAGAALDLIAAAVERGVSPSVGGGWAVDALVGRQTRQHRDLDLWVAADDAEGLFAAFVGAGVDRVLPWPGDRPWNFVLHDGVSRRVDVHFYEPAGDGRLRYGSAADPFDFAPADITAQGLIAGTPVRCESAPFALRNHAGYPARECDRHDIALLRELVESERSS